LQNNILTIITLFIISFLVRIFVIFILPEATFSSDMINWLEIAKYFNQGGSPYKSTTFINWGPVWPFYIYLLDNLSRNLNISLILGIKFFLSFIDSSLVVLSYLLLKFNDTRIKSVLLLMALNPFVIILSTIHSNFDSLLMIIILLATITLISFQKNDDKFYFYLGMFFLGIAVVTKTNSKLNIKDILFGLILTILPIVIFLITIFPLYPEATYRNIISYKSYAVIVFGFSWITRGGERINSFIGSIHTVVFLISLLILSVKYPKKLSLTDVKSLPIIIFTIFLFILVFGPGVSPHYFIWIWPFLPIIITIPQLKKIIISFIAIATISFALIYSAKDLFGSFYYQCPDLASKLIGRYRTFCDIAQINEFFGGLILTIIALKIMWVLLNYSNKNLIDEKSTKVLP
jgi:hypothetical protein